MAWNEFDNDPTKLLLGAVNTLLNYIGEDDLETEDDIETLMEARQARKYLIEAKKEALSEEWDYNTDENYTLPLGVGGIIAIPSNIMRVTSPDSDLIIRNHQLYSKSAQSNVFTEAQTVNVVWDIAFNELPQELRWYITMKASRMFRYVILGDGDTAQNGFTAEDERQAYMNARRAEASTTNANMLNPSFDINRG